MSSSGETRLHFEGVLEKAGKRFFELPTSASGDCPPPHPPPKEVTVCVVEPEQYRNIKPRLSLHRGFRKRWFTLDEQHLTYFKAPEKTEENYLGCIDFSQVKSVNPVKMVNNGFQILTKNRTYTFSAPTPELLTDWMSVLRQAMQLKSFERCNSRLRSQDSTDSQYEEVTKRPQRSFSADHSFDEDDTTDDLYSSIKGPLTKGPSAKRAVGPQGPGEYSFVGAASLPRAPGNGGDACMYELVGSRPSSKSAPPTYEMAHSLKKTDAPENDGGFYDLVQNVEKQTSPKSLGDVSLTQQEATVPDMQTDADEKQEQCSDVPPLYSTVSKIQRKQQPNSRGLSMISEGENEQVEELSTMLTSEKNAAPHPPPPEKEAYAIHEIKRFLEETTKEDEENDVNYEKTNGKDEKDDAFLVRSGSAFEQLKAFLQKLDSTEAQ